MRKPPCDVLILKGKGSLAFFHGNFSDEDGPKCQLLRISLVTELVKNLSEEPLEMGMATHSSTLPWEIPRTEEPGGL